jgi:hypothetical protein
MHSEGGGQRQSFGTAREHSGTYTWHARKTRRVPSMEHAFNPEQLSFTGRMRL